MPLQYTDIQTLLIFSSLFLVTFFLSRYAERYPKRANLSVFLIILLLSLVCGLRSTDVGRDTAAYYRDIQLMQIGNINALDYYEIGYTVFVKLLLFITNSAQWVVFTIALLTISLIVVRLWEMHETISFSKAVCFFFCISYSSLFSGIRQWVAVAIVFFASRYIVKEKYMTFLVFVIIAVSFHLPAIISLATLVVYLLFIKIIKRKIMRSSLLILSFVAFIALSVNMDYITSRTRYSISFFKQEPDIGFMIIARVVILMLFYFNYRSSRKTVRNRELSGQNNIAIIHMPNYFLYATASMLGGLFGSSIGRLSWYFIPYEWSLFASGLLCKRHWTYWIVKFLVYTVIFYSFYSFVVVGMEYLTPYSFFWE